MRIKCVYGVMAFLFCCFLLGGCAQEEVEVSEEGNLPVKQELAEGVPEANVVYPSSMEYTAKLYSLNGEEADISWMNSNEVFYVDKQYMEDDNGEIQIKSELYQYNWVLEEDKSKLGEVDKNVSAICMDAPKSLYLLTEQNLEDVLEVGVIEWSLEKEEVSKEIELQDTDLEYVHGFRKIGENFFLWNRNKLSAFNGDGNRLWTFENEAEIVDVSFGRERVLVCLRTDQEGSVGFWELQADSGELKRKTEDLEPYDVEQIAYKSENEIWLLNHREGMASYHMEEDSYEKVFEWINADISDISVIDMLATSQGEILVAVEDGIAGEDRICSIYSGVKPYTGEKKDIYFSLQWMDDLTKQAVVEFNRNHPGYRIVPQTCTELELYDDYRRKVDMEFAAGNGADIFFMPEESYETYLSKGLLLDLAPLFAEDDTINREDYVQKAWARYEEGGCLYAVPTCFSMESVVGKKEVFQDIKGWSLEEMMETVEKMPQVKELLTRGSKEEVLLYCCRAIISENSSFDYESDTFIQMLEFANKYGCSKARIAELDDGFMYHKLEEQNLLMGASLSGPESISRYCALLGGEISVVGYPSEDLVQAYMHEGRSLAIRADSEYAELAWEFIKLLLSEKYQREQYASPVLESALQERFEEVLYNTAEDNLAGFMIGNEYVTVMSPTAEDVETIRLVIENSVPYPYEAENIYNIIYEEASSYFDGQKSPQEVAKIIQNRVQLYWEERQ